jgi:uncharacterized protein (TIGR04255 family)
MASATETFPKAPIAEALLEIQVVNPPFTEEEKPLSFYEFVAARFPQKQARVKHEVTVHVGEVQPQTAPDSEVCGYFFTSPENGKVVYAGKDSYSFHKLRPYENWNAFRVEARELWGLYRTHLQPTNVSRVSVRNINRIEVPLPIRDLRDYCLLFPDLPAQLPQSLSEFFMRFVIPDSESATTGIITLTFEPPKADESILGLILDIDVFQEFAVLSPDEERIWDTLETLRDYKNRIFMSSTTETAKQLFR